MIVYRSLDSDKIIDQYGVGWYSGIETKFNNELRHYYILLPEIIINDKNSKKEYLYKLKELLYIDFLINRLDDNDNKKYNEKIIDYFPTKSGSFGYMNYSYADVYYEMIYQLAKKNNMNLEKIVQFIDVKDIYNVIRKYYEDNNDFFEEKVNEYIRKREI